MGNNCHTERDFVFKYQKLIIEKHEGFHFKITHSFA